MVLVSLWQMMIENYCCGKNKKKNLYNLVTRQVLFIYTYYWHGFSIAEFLYSNQIYMLYRTSAMCKVI